MNLIVENEPRIEWYTDLYPFFREIESVVRSYSWLWTDIVVNAPLPTAEDHHPALWMNGDAIFDFAAQRPHFDWSVLSAIPRTQLDAAKAIDCTPYADGNPDFWTGSPVPQHPNAAFEIVCWDSSATLVIGADVAIEKAFRRAYPGVRDLDADNANRPRKNAT